MRLYITAVANTQSAKKAIRSSARKREHNLLWREKVKTVAKNLRNLLKDSKADAKVLTENLTTLQKYLDKAVKEKVIHKNRANRLKSRYAKKISARGQSTKPAKTEAAKPAKPKAKPKSKSA